MNKLTALTLSLLLIPHATAANIPKSLASDVATIQHYYATVAKRLPGSGKTGVPAPEAAPPAPQRVPGSERDPFAVSPRLHQNQRKPRLGEPFLPAANGAELGRIRLKAILYRGDGVGLVTLQLDGQDSVTLAANESFTLGNNALRVKAIQRDSVTLEAGSLPSGLMILR